MSLSSSLSLFDLFTWTFGVRGRVWGLCGVGGEGLEGGLRMGIGIRKARNGTRRNGMKNNH